MPNVDRRHFLKYATDISATLAWGCSTLRPSSSGWRERRDLYPQGVASGDPDADSVLLWTRRPGKKGVAKKVSGTISDAFARVALIA